MSSDMYKVLEKNELFISFDRKDNNTELLHRDHIAVWNNRPFNGDLGAAQADIIGSIYYSYLDRCWKVLVKPDDPNVPLEKWKIFVKERTALRALRKGLKIMRVLLLLNGRSNTP